ncbi:transporter substrate-binding domain-containing protein [Nocardia sp. CDC153]|uniref:transporter substrate-binding domain-containing protein n=1 Tax=Nocardia sp. CDC153 TaxID=3112167 RepID=UPI002DBFBE05|nr:transporter substrate-binding domain-containing protein [Nocardia sp. CDC153]MEC3953759.1 transporter substrate-binding domain-containing protein [Nocardia sp. CDC153]
MRVSTRLLPLLSVIAVGWLLPAGVVGPAASAESTPSRLVTVAQSGVLRVCTTGDYPPYTVRGADGTYAGVDITLATDLAGSLHAVPQWISTTWASLADDFVAKCDLAVGGISDTAERRRVADFSIPISTDGKTPVTRRDEGDAYSTIADINQPGARVIVNPGGTNEKFARANFPDAQLIVWPDNLTIYDQLEQGNADVFVTDSVEGRYRTRTHPDLQVLHPDHPFDSAPKAYLLPRGDLPFNTVVNAWLQTQLATGRPTQLLDTWID